MKLSPFIKSLVTLNMFSIAATSAESHGASSAAAQYVFGNGPSQEVDFNCQKHEETLAGDMASTKEREFLLAPLDATPSLRGSRRDLQGGRIVLYEGNNGSQNIVCTLEVKSGFINFKEDDFGCDNDEARSMWLFYVPEGTIITVYDSPSGSLEDDSTEIRVRQSEQDYIVKSFEADVDDDIVKVTHFRNNGLDGKVSAVRITT